MVYFLEEAILFFSEITPLLQLLLSIYFLMWAVHCNIIFLGLFSNWASKKSFIRGFMAEKLEE